MGITAEDIYNGKLLERVGLLFNKLQSEDAVCPQRVWLLFGRGLSQVLGAAPCPAQPSVLLAQAVCLQPRSLLGAWSNATALSFYPTALSAAVYDFWMNPRPHSLLIVSEAHCIGEEASITTWPCSGVVGLCAAH